MGGLRVSGFYSINAQLATLSTAHAAWSVHGSRFQVPLCFLFFPLV